MENERERIDVTKCSAQMAAGWKSHLKAYNAPKVVLLGGGVMSMAGKPIGEFMSGTLTDYTPRPKRRPERVFYHEPAAWLRLMLERNIFHSRADR